MLTGKYQSFHADLHHSIDRSRIITDPLRTLTYGTDASLYRLIPKIVIIVEAENEVIETLKKCREYKIPVTFRAAGTSLSGQAISDSVLMMLGTGWRGFNIHSNGENITLQPGVIGAHANIYLSQYNRKIGPDPASINSAMIGGIAANNSSGMCCGVVQNSYHTLAAMRIIFVDGTVLDTEDELSRQHFLSQKKEMTERIVSLAQRVKENTSLANRIREKYRMKNTTGYSLNALIDFDDPIDIIQHLMIGSEGTLGFMSQITYHSVPEYPFKASSLIFFSDIKSACESVIALKDANVNAVELMDYASLRSVEKKLELPEHLWSEATSLSALLVETRAESEENLQNNIHSITNTLEPANKLLPVSFTTVPQVYTKYWDIRKGLFPALGIMRPIGTTVIIEDITFAVPDLADATIDLQKLFLKNGYTEAIIFGHARDGNLHFVFNQNFDSQAEIRRYQVFMDDVAELVVGKYDGALKSEHGTGRNMAPFVEMEWGKEAYELMKEIKHIFDPENILNPGVILNDDPKIHLKNLKPIPAAHPVIDKCIECGFCEVNCPSRDLTLTPRHRIVAYREIHSLERTKKDPERLSTLKKLYRYQGDQTCATDGMCATSCPVEIDTGKLIKILRANNVSPTADSIASLIANHFGFITNAFSISLTAVDKIHGLVGTNMMTGIAKALRKMSGNKLPQWNSYTPRGNKAFVAVGEDEIINGEQVVYFPSCVSRIMGVSRGSNETDSQITVTLRILEKSGYQVIIPDNVKNLCCGMIFNSKGYIRQGDKKAKELCDTLMRLSHSGEYPILFDTSPCVFRMKELYADKLQILDIAEFSHKHLIKKLNFKMLNTTIAVHSPCSSRKMMTDKYLVGVARLCAEKVIVPPLVGCCGFAGDRGFYFPELTSSALNSLPESLPSDCSEGFSTSRTCEIGMSVKSGIPYKSIIYLIKRCTVQK